MFGWFNLPLQIAFGIGLSHVVLKMLSLIGI